MQVQILPPDQHHSKGADTGIFLQTLTLGSPGVHKRTQVRLANGHVTPGQRQLAPGKRLPDDVREEYGRRHDSGLRQVFAIANTGSAEAKRLFREWENELKRVAEAIRGRGQARA